MTYIRLDINLLSGSELYARSAYMVFLNGEILGVTRTPDQFVANFRRIRRAGRISPFISIYTNTHHKSVHIATDGGRVCRPLIIVDHCRPRVKSEHIRVSVNTSNMESRLKLSYPSRTPTTRCFQKVLWYLMTF
jgi:DNA-directed RNA polymerase beta subunit